MDLNDPRITDPLLRRVMRIAAEEHPTIKYVFKDRVWWWKVLYYTVIWMFNRKFMTHYTTTMGTELHFPNQQWFVDNQNSVARILAHELVHLRNHKKQGLAVAWLSYFFPQNLGFLALPALGGFWIPELFWFLLFLLALAPFPAYWRMEEEMSAYRMTIAFQYWADGGMHPNYIGVFADHFVKSQYYFMWPFRKQVEARLGRYLREVQEGTVRDDILFERMYQAIHSDY